MQNQQVIILCAIIMSLLSSLFGTEPLRLIRDDFIDSCPSWSPDGKQISFVSKRGRDYCLALTPPSCGAVKLIARDVAKNSRYTWSPDSKQIAYVAKTAGEKEIHVVDVASGEIKTAGKGENPAFSPHNNRLAYSTGKDILVYDLPSGKLQNLTEENNASVLEALALSPDGKIIYFAKDGNLWQVSAGGKDQILLFDHLAENSAAPTVGRLAAAHDGKAVFVSLITDGLYADATDNILAWYDINNKTMRNICDANSWSLSGDGRYAAFAINGNIFLYNLITRKKELLCSGTEPAFSPDGKAIVYLHKEKPLDENEVWIMPVGNAR